MNKPIVKIKLLPGGKMPEKKTAGAAAYDCFAREDVIIDRQPALIKLGFAMEIPPGYHAKIYPRSSTGLKTTLRMANSVGIIDSDYRGEVCFIGESNKIEFYQEGNITTFTAIGYHVFAGERIAQMIIEKNEDVKLIEVDQLSETERGEGGFGSTGR